MATKMKTCSNGAWCVTGNATQPITNFHNYSRAKDGKKPECKECRLSYQRDYDYRNSVDRTYKRTVYSKLGGFFDKCIAYNYLAKKLGIKAKYNLGVGIDDAERARVRKVVNQNFDSPFSQQIAFNLLSYQLGQTARA